MAQLKLWKFFSVLMVLMLIASVGAVVVPASPAEADGVAHTLNVAKWTDPTAAGVSGREAVIKVGNTYHMWYSSSDSAIYHTSSNAPTGFAAGAQCTFDTPPKEVGSVTILEENDIFYMIAYGSTDKVFNIYTSDNGTGWANKGLVFDGTGLQDYNKIDGPYLFKDGNKYRLYFQVKTPADTPTRYDIYTAESTAASLAVIVGTGDTVDFTLASTNPVLSPSATSADWDGKWVMHPWVVKDGGTYYMWYSAHNSPGDSPQQIGVASSANGYDWVKSPGNPILPRATYAAVGEPSVIKDGDTWRMWYLATGNAINYLTATGPFEFSSIQSAINKASDGDTINVAAGTYNERVVINESLTLQGAGDPIIKAPDSSVAFSFTESTKSWEPVVFAFGGTETGGVISGTETITVTISGFTIDGNNHVPTADRSAGILLRNAKGDILNNTVQNMSIDGKETYGIAAYGDSDVVISGNNVSGYARVGIVASGDNGTNPDPNAIITGNIVTGLGKSVLANWAPNGIQIGFGATGKVTGNTVSGNGYPGTDWTGSGILVATSDDVEVTGNTVEENETGIGTSGVINGTLIHDNTVDGNTYGISIQNQAVNTTIENNIIKNSSYDGIDICNYTGYGDPPIGTTIQGNTITANNTENDETSGGIWVDDGVDGDEVSIHFNNIVGNNGFGVLNTSTTNTIDATSNWWGYASGPYHVSNPTGAGNKVSDNVNFEPWLVLNLSAVPPGPVTADGTSFTTLTASVKNSDNTSPTYGTNVVFTTSKGKFDNGGSTVTKTTSDGVATATLTSISSTSTVIADITATVIGVVMRGAVFFQPTGAPTPTNINTAAVTDNFTITGTPTGGSVSIEATGEHTITTAKYDGNPAGTPTFQATGNYYDVHLDSAENVTTLKIQFKPATASTVIYYWTGSTWAPCSNQAYDAGGFVTVTVTADTTQPKLSDLEGLFFGSGTPRPAPTPTPAPTPAPTPPVSGISTALPQSHGAGGMSAVTPPQGPMPLPNMLVQSAAITAGKQVSAKVTNTGGASGSLRVTLYAGNNAMESKNVSLAPGDIATVSFDASSLGPGTYDIKVNNVPAGQLTVEGDSSSLFFIALAAFLVLMVALFIIYFRRRRAAGW